MKTKHILFSAVGAVLLALSFAPSAFAATSCPTGEVLFNGNCIANSAGNQQTSSHGIPEGSVQVGGVCYADDPQAGSFDCAGNLSCQSGFCRTDYTCDAPCGQQNGGVAHGDQCAYNADCADDLNGPQYSCLDGTCQEDQGTLTEGSTCGNTNECYGGLECISHICQVQANLQGGTGASGNPTGSTNTGSGASLNTTYIQGYANSIELVINTILVPLLIAIAFIVFLWGVFNYFIRGAADPKSRTEGAQFIMWALIGFVVIFSVWGIVQILMGTLSLTAGSAHPKPPTL